MNCPRFAILLSIGLLASPPFCADPAVAAPASTQGRGPVMLLKGKLLSEATFDQSPASTAWETSGDVSVIDGQLEWASEKGKEKASLKPALLKKDGVTLGNHILEYTFRYHEELYRNQIVYNDEHGHAIIIELSPDLHHVRKWPDQDVLHRFEEFPDASGSNLQPGELYTMTIEMRDSEFLVRINEENLLFGENYRVGRAKHRLAVSFEGGQGTLESIRIWEGTPNPDWEKNRQTWVAKQQERLPWNGDARKDFGFRFRVAELRRKLRENGDPDYAAIVNETAGYLAEIRALYPFYGGKPTRQNLAAKKDARLNDERYQSMINQLALLEKENSPISRHWTPHCVAMAELLHKKGGLPVREIHPLRGPGAPRYSLEMEVFGNSASTHKRLAIKGNTNASLF